MRFFTRWPLHYQILLALVLGTIFGLLFNPGDVDLPNADATVSTDGEAIVLVEHQPGGDPGYQERFSSKAAFKSSYPNLADQLEKRQDEPLDVAVQSRRLHLAEDESGIMLNYTRRYDGARAITHVKVPNASQLAAKYPQWTDEYQQYAKTWSRPVSIISKYIGDLFLRLLRMITVPLIVTSLVTGVAGLQTTSRLGSMFGKTLLYYLATSLLAITTGILCVNLIRPGIGAQLPGGADATDLEVEQSLSGIFMRLLNDMIPANPVESLANADFLAIITFSVLVGLFILKIGGPSGETLRNLFRAGFDLMMSLTLAIIRLAPIGVFAFMAYATATQGIEVFQTLAWYMLAVFAGLVVHACVVLPLIVKFIAKRSPWKYAQAMSPALMTAFSTASSNGTLPLTITCVEERAGISNRVSSFVLPLGATINMDGTALYEAVAVLFIAQAYFGPVPIDTQIFVAITALLASVGAAGIPHAGLVMMAIVLQAAGLPLAAQGVIIAVDRVLDMCRTSVNVWSDSCGCAVVDRFQESESDVSVQPPPAPV